MFSLSLSQSVFSCKFTFYFPVPSKNEHYCKTLTKHIYLSLSCFKTLYIKELKQKTALGTVEIISP